MGVLADSGTTRRANVVVLRFRSNDTSGASRVRYLDRIDIHIDVPAVKFRDLSGETPPETDDSETIRARVIAARERQLKRLGSEKTTNIQNPIVPARFY